MPIFGSQKDPENFDHYKKMIEEIITDWDLDPEMLYNPEIKSWSLVQGSADFFITLFTVDNIDFFEVAASIVKRPDDDADQLPFFEKLLELNDFYIGVKLSIKDNQIWLLGQRECEGMDKQEARNMIDNVRLIADDIDDKLMEEFGVKK